MRATIERLSAGGLEWFAVTSIDRDGMLTGPDLEGLMALRAAFPAAHLVASGGISSMADLIALSKAGMTAAILGRSLYEGRIELPEALAAVSPASDVGFARYDGG